MSFRDHENLNPDEDSESYQYPENRPEIRVLSVEKYNDRYSLRDDRPEPRVAAWRSNLVASPKRRNLLFVAYGTEIYVWVPSGPYQKLGFEPEMIIKPQMKNPRAAGYIDRNEPHTINNILVDDLGRDEVLLLATDSGNVTAYHVEAIYSAINRCDSRNDKRPFADSEVTPFFMESVGLSAWGLAMHKFARLIAVSSNTGHITVFAMALVNPNSVKKKDDSQPQVDQEPERLDDTWVNIDTKRDLQTLRQSSAGNYRSRNLRLTYKGHLDNIPCVSFANFDLDANGEWMVSTDITNQVMIWRLWEDLSPHRSYYPGHPHNNPPQRGWSVIPLDPRTFKRHETREEACGCDPEVQVFEGRKLLDLSRGIEDLYDTSQSFWNSGPTVDAINGESDEDKYYDHDDDSDEGCLPRTMFTSPLPSVSRAFGCAENSELDRDEGQNEEEDHLSDISDLEMSEPRTHIMQEKSPVSTLFEESNPHYRMESEVFYRPVGREPRLNFDYLKRHPVHPPSPSFFPVIHFSEHNITLAPYPLDSEYHLVSNGPLFQEVYFHAPISVHCDRFNMVKYIPELGLIVAASQKGRVAIISLCWQEETGFTFRLDWIVPFRSQELRHERPPMPLLGIAVSPMPGFENPPDVPYIPQGVDLNDRLTFNYRTLNPDSGSEDSTSPPSFHTRTLSSHRSTSDRPLDESLPDAPPLSDTEQEAQHFSHTPRAQSSTHSPTVAELHAQASVRYRPREPWHGWHPSRHYRLMLLFFDHNVMSYEFWHDWS